MCLQVDISKSGTVTGLRLEPLGEVSLPSCMAYVDDGVVFVGSLFGDSQLVKLAPERGADGGCLSMLSTEQNIGPIIDFCLVDSEQHGYSHFVSCSGAFKDSSLRIVKSGVGVEEQAAVDLEGIKGLWALQENGSDCMLVQSFVGETRVLKLANDELQESDVNGFDMASASLLCGNVSRDVYFQVTAAEVRLGGAVQVVWQCANDRITSAAAHGSDIVLCCKGGLVVKLRASLPSSAAAAASLDITGRVQLPSDIACVSMNPLVAGQPADLACFGLWNHSIVLVRLSDMAVVHTEQLPLGVLSRSVLAANLDSTPSLLVGMGDGSVISYTLQWNGTAVSSLTQTNKFSIGAQAVQLCPFQSKDSVHVFACCDRPAVFYGQSGKIMYSNVGVKDVHHMCGFRCCCW